MSVTQEKKELRTQMRSMRRALDGQAIEGFSHSVVQSIIQSGILSGCNVVLLYNAFDGEVDLSALKEYCAQQSICVCLPRCCDAFTMQAVFSTQFKKSAMGVLEPIDGTVMAPDAIDLVLVPGLAFDETCHRLGFGAGYYDRYLRQTSAHAKAYGIGYDFQLLPKIPVLQHDYTLHGIITPSNFIARKDELYG